MKISELQEILEHYKQENGDLEIRIVTETPITKIEEILTSTDLKLSLVYNYNELVKIMETGLLADDAINKLKERGLATTYLNIYKYIE